MSNIVRFVVAIALIISATLLHAQKTRSESELDYWWTERAAIFYPKFSFTLTTTRSALVAEPALRIDDGPRSISRNGKIDMPDAILATDYTHTGTANGLWSATGDWTPTPPAGGPNAAGDIARYQGGSSINTTNSAGAVTTGNIISQGANNNSWTITPTAAITLNQDSGGAGTATLSNTNTNTGTNNALILSTGTWTLADDLLITNTGGSTNATGAIQINGTLGGTGNLTLSNVNTAVSQTGSIRFQTGTNGFTGTVLVQKGTTTFNNASSFGGVAGNTITLGQSGQGSAALAATTTIATTIANNIIVASGSGGTLTLGSVSTAASGGVTYGGTVTLNGDLSLTSANTGTGSVTLSGIVSGVGNLTKVGVGIATLSNANTFTGNTLISGGTLKLGNNLALQNSALDTSGAGVMNVTGFTTPTFGGLTGSTNLASVITTGYSSVTALTLNPQSGSQSYSGVIANGAAGMTLTKTGAGTQTLSNANTYTGATTIATNGGTLIAGAVGALGSTASIVVNGGGTLALSGSGNLNRINNSAGITLGTTSGTAGTILRSGSGTVSEGAGATRSGATITGSSSVGLGALTLASNSILDFGSGGVGTLVFSSFTPAGFVLNILNYTSTASGLDLTQSGVDGTDDRLIFNQDQITKLANFSFDGTAAKEILLDTGFYEIVPLTPVPEPSTWIGGALALVVIGYSSRKRFVRRAA